MKPAFFLGLLWVTVVGLAWPLSVGGKGRTEWMKLGSPTPALGPETPPCLVPHLWHCYGVRAVALSADSKWIVTGGDDKTARLWDLATGKEVRRFQGHTLWVWSVALSKDGKWLVTGGKDETARLWQVSSGKEIRSFPEHTWGVNSLALSGDGKRLVTGSLGGTGRMWDVSSGKLLRGFQGHGATQPASIPWS
jgi:WD40 repeat protein